MAKRTPLMSWTPLAVVVVVVALLALSAPFCHADDPADLEERLEQAERELEMALRDARQLEDEDQPLPKMRGLGAASTSKNNQRGKSMTLENRPPVLLVPGLGGSKLKAKLTNRIVVPHPTCHKNTKTYYQIWVNTLYMMPVAIDCTVANMKQQYDPASHKTYNTQGVDIQTFTFGDPDSVQNLVKSTARKRRRRKRGQKGDKVALPSWKQPAFAQIIKGLENLGYIQKKNIVAAPYDFRKAPNEMSDLFANIKQLIERTYENNGYTRVVVVAHSMGNRIMKYFYNNEVSQAWKDKHIREHVALGAPWNGAAKSLKNMVYGDNLGIPWNKPNRDFFWNMASVAFHLPSPDRWPRSMPLVTTQNGDYYANDYKQLFIDMGCAHCYAMWIDANKRDKLRVAPGVKMHMLYGNDSTTLAGMVDRHFPSEQPESEVSETGDGTVALHSLQAFHDWKDVSDVPLPGADHLKMLQDDRVIQYVLDVVRKTD